MPTKKRDDDRTEPDRLVRQTAGSYRTVDDRFEVRKGGVGWYLVDLERTNELGQELLHGPFATLAQARDEIPAARKVVPLATPRRSGRAAAAKPAPVPPPPPKTWIDRLPDDEQADVRRLIRAVEQAGVAGADELVNRARGTPEPVLAAALIEQKLRALIDDGEPDQRRDRRELARRVLAILVDDGELSRPPLPRWELNEKGPKGDERRRLRPTV